MLGLVALPCLGGRRHPHRSLLGAGGRGEGWQVEGASGVATEPHSPGRAAGGRGGVETGGSKTVPSQPGASVSMGQRPWSPAHSEQDGLFSLLGAPCQQPQPPGECRNLL